MNYKIVERDAFQVIGIKKEFPCHIGGERNEGIPGVAAFWEEMNKCGLVNRLSELNNGQIKGLLGITLNYNKIKSIVDYWIATEHHSDEKSEFESLWFPALEWIVFEVRGAVPKAIVHAWKYIHSEWFPSSGYEPAPFPYIEAYLDSDLTSSNAYNEIWIPVK